VGDRRHAARHRRPRRLQALRPALLFLRYLSLRYEQRREQLEALLKDLQSEYYTGDSETDAEILEDPSEYARDNVLVVPEEASWDYLRRNARAGDIKLRLDNAMRLLEERHPRLQGVLPRIYSGSNLEADQVAELINLFSRDIFARQNGADLLGRTYEYFIANPPFNLRGWGADKLDAHDARLQIGYSRSQPTDANANTMWMMHFLSHVADGGAAGYVMANGSMTTNTAQERATRQALVDEGFVDCIVQLPDRLFFQTGIPCCLWFLSRNRGGTHGYRYRRDEILFVDARAMGQMVTRRQRALTDDEIARIARVYRRYKRYDLPDDEPGFCKIATLEDVQAHDYKLTPGIYVGTQADDGEGEPFEEAMPRRIEELRGLFAESSRLQDEILADLEGLL
jgi:type I restriction-modification system DNA methylase subunit